MLSTLDELRAFMRYLIYQTGKDFVACVARSRDGKIRSDDYIVKD
jgi:hypothetical protein